MRTCALLVFTLLLALSGWLSKPPHLFSASKTKHIAVPPSTSYNYPLAEAQLEQIRNDPQAIRAHGWSLLQHLIVNDGTGKGENSGYYTDWDAHPELWEGKCTLGLATNSKVCSGISPTTDDCRRPMQRTNKEFKFPIQLPIQQHITVHEAAMVHHLLFDGPLRAKDGTLPEISFVRYNVDAAAFIRKHCLHSLTGIQQLTDADQFNPNAIIVKLIWGKADDKDGWLHVWRPEMVNSPTLEDITTWPLIKVAADDSLPCTASTYPEPPGSRSGVEPVPVVPIKCFYHRSYPCSYLDDGPEMFEPRTFCPKGQYFEAVLLGLHIITAEQKNWTWNTYWWTPTPITDFYHADQPAVFKDEGPWRFYAMDATLSPTEPRKPNAYQRAVFNPYIEGLTANATRSNCIYCHSMAVTRHYTPPDLSHEIHSGSPPPCAYQVITNECLRQLSANDLLPRDDAYFKDTSSTHLIWSIADNQPLPPRPTAAHHR